MGPNQPHCNEYTKEELMTENAMTDIKFLNDELTEAERKIAAVVKLYREGMVENQQLKEEIRRLEEQNKELMISNKMLNTPNQM